MSYWFIIGTAPPVRVFMCIHMNTHVLPVNCHEFDTSCVRTGTVLLVRVITWKTRDFTVNTCRHTKFVYRIRWIHVRKYVNWASWTHELTYRTCEIRGRCLLELYTLLSKKQNWQLEPDACIAFKIILNPASWDFLTSAKLLQHYYFLLSDMTSVFTFPHSHYILFPIIDIFSQPFSSTN